MPASVNADLERRWGLATTHTLVWPAAALDPARLALACAEVAGSVDPGSFIGRRVAERARDAGLSPDEFLACRRGDFVVAGEYSTLDDLLAAVAARERDGLPFSFLVCPRGFALSHSHALGDGTVSARLLEAVLRSYADAGPRPVVPTATARNRDLLLSMGRIWWHRPRAVPRTVAGVLRRFRYRPASMIVPPDGVLGAYRVAAVTLGETDVAALDRWRRDHDPAPSMSVAVLWLVARTLAAHGYPRGPQPWQVMVSMRGAAERLAGLGGNLVGRALIDIDPGCRVQSVQADLRRQTVSGEIVAMHLLKTIATIAASVLSARHGARRGPQSAPSARIGTSPGLSWSDRGRQAFGKGFADVIPRRGPVPPAAYTYVSPAQDGIGVNVNWLGDRVGLVFVFGSSPLDDAAIDGVVATLNGGVHALLPGTAQST